MVGTDVSTVSKHLSVLKNAGLVPDEKRGSQVFYSLRVPCILNFFSCVEAVLQANAEEQSALAIRLFLPIRLAITPNRKRYRRL